MIKPKKIIAGGLIVIVGSLIISWQIFNWLNNDPKSVVEVPSGSKTETNQLSSTVATTTESEPELLLPVVNYYAGQTKKTFGQYILPANSPVQPERFQGYHTGVDIEAPATEAESEVHAIAAGRVVISRWASGYGGVVAIEHQLDNERVVAIYGHLDPARLPALDQLVVPGEKIGYLGQAYSRQTDGERAHLHFALYRAEGVSLAGYVKNAADLVDWLDPNVLFPLPSN